MARPKKLYADWFPHYNNMRDHRKIKALRSRFGQLEGYALYCMLVEILTGSDNHVLRLDDIELELYAAEIGVTGVRLNEFIDYCCRLNLFQCERDGDVMILSCVSLVDNLSPLIEKRKRDRKDKRAKSDNGVIDSDNGVIDNENPVFAGESTHRTGQDRTVEYSKDPTYPREILKTFKNQKKEELPPPSSATPPPSVGDAAILDDADFFSEMVRYANNCRNDLNGDPGDFVKGVLGKLKLKAKDYENYRLAAMYWLRTEKLAVKNMMPEKIINQSKKIIIR